MTITKRSVFPPQQLPRYMLFIQNNDEYFGNVWIREKFLLRLLWDHKNRVIEEHNNILTQI